MSNVEISTMYEALDNMDDYALMAGIKPTGPHKVLTDAIAELEQLRRQNHSLLAALEELASKADELCRWDRRFDDVLDAADSAIASVKGQP